MQFLALRIAAILLSFLATAAQAQTSTQIPDPGDPGENINFAYSAILGTGVYRVGERDIYVFRIPIFWTQRDAEITAAGKTKPGIKWVFPVTFGLYEFNLDKPPEGLPQLDDIGTITFLPGIELYWPRPSGWEVRPYAQVGAGADFLRDEWTSIYAAGVMGQYPIIPFDVDRVGVYYGHRIVVAGFRPERGGDESLGYLSFGLDIRWPQSWRIFDQGVYLSFMTYANLYFDEARFVNIFDERETVQREITVGASIGGVPQFEIMGVGFERLGMGFKFGPNVRALTFFASFPF